MGYFSNKRPSNLVQTIECVDNLLKSHSKDPQGLSFNELTGQVGLPKGTTHRLVSSLSYFNNIKKYLSDRKNKLGFKLATFGNLLLDHIDLRSESQPFLSELNQYTRRLSRTVFEKALHGIRMTVRRFGNTASMCCCMVL